jgi:hypothetical protein
VSTLGSLSFWVDTGERAVRAFAQGLTVAWGLGLPFIGLSVPWNLALLAAGCFSLVTVVTCVASLMLPKADKDTGSFLAMPPYQLTRLRGWITHK